MLGMLAWVLQAPLHPILGAWADKTKSYDLGLSLVCGLPMIAFLTLALIWPKSKTEPGDERNQAIN